MVVYTRIHLVIVSIHTPTQGVTPFIFAQVSDQECFNPHTHAGCDTPPASAKADSNVSIHTPTQGVTEVKCFTSESKIVSIHTPTQGVTQYSGSDFPYIRFQSTHPRRVWLIRTVTILQHISFNPHTHAGCDLIVIVDSIKEEFQSTHPRRVCLELPEDLTGIVVSIHTPTQGVTQDGQWYQMTIDGFNPHTHAGCDCWFYS